MSADKSQPHMKCRIKKKTSVDKKTWRICKGDIIGIYTFSKGNLFFPIEDRVSLCDPTRTKLLVRTALGPPGLATTTHRNNEIINTNGA